MKDGKEKRLGFLKRLRLSKKKQVLFCVGSMVFIVGTYVLALSYLIQYKVDNLEIIKDDFSWVYQIDEVIEDNKKIVITGWAFKLQEDSQYNSYDIVLRDIDTEKKYVMKNKFTSRKDVNDYFFCEYDYSKSGFQATISKTMLNDKDNLVFEIMFHPKGSNDLYATNVFFFNGKVINVNPKEYKELDVEGTHLERIVKEGEILLYRPDKGLYVYQFDNDLYWLAEENYKFKNGKSPLYYRVETTQDKLLNMNSNYKVLDFIFEENEIVEWSTDKYRVVKQPLPQEYAISKIWLGNYASEWRWIQCIRPVYYISH